MTRKPAAFLLLFSLCLFPFFGESKPVKQILIVHSYHQGLQWTDSITEAVEKTFAEAGGNYELYFEYLDTKRNSGPEYFQRLTEFEKQKTQLAELDFDLIICSDNDALNFLASNGKDLFGPIPIVFCGVNNFTPSMLQGQKNITGITETLDFVSNLKAMEKLHPDRSHILFIVDRTSTGNAITEELQNIIGEYEGQFTFEYLRDFSVETIDETLSSLTNNDLIYLLVMNIDRNGTFISYSKAISLVRNAVNVPIYGSWDFYFGKGILGGMLISAERQGEQASRIALQILEGARPEEIPVEIGAGNEFRFDYREMERFGIGKSALPPGSIIEFVPDSFFKRHEATLWTIGLTAVLFLLILISVSLYLRNRNHRLEEMNRLLDERVQQALSEVNTLNGLLPICAHCKKIRDDSGYWNRLETYIKKHSNAEFSHGLCPDCAAELYPTHFKKKEEETS